MPRRLPLLLALLIAPIAVAAQTPAAGLSLNDVLARAGDAVAQYYARAQSIVSTETVVLQPLKYDLSPDTAFPRRLVYERRVAWDATADGQAPEARVLRELVSANNRAPRPRDKPKCFDKDSTTPDAIQMLLPANQGDYEFKLARPGRSERRPALILEFTERRKASSRITATPKEGVDDCYTVPLEGHYRGRIWLSPDTFEVLQIDTRLKGPLDVSARERGKRAFDATFERSDTTTIYRAVSFTDPDETIILPASVVMLHAQTGYRQREMTTFSNYRRFVTEARIVTEP
jgi:hypothetical protein